MVKRLAILAALLCCPLAAHAANYLIICSPSTCTASDGSTQPAGMALARIVYDGHATYTAADGAGNTNDVALIPDDGRAVYAPAIVPQTTITAAAFLARFTPTEIATAWGKTTTDATNGPIITVGLLQGLSGGTVNLAGCPASCSDPTTTAFMAALVASGAITSARATQIETLSEASP